MTNERVEIPARPSSPYTPPPIGGEPRLYALLAVEMKPGYIAYFHVELDHEVGACTIDMDRDDDGDDITSFGEPLRFRTTSAMHITATLSGTVVSDRADYRPPTRTPSHIAEDALTGITRPLPLPGGAPS